MSRPQLDYSFNATTLRPAAILTASYVPTASISAINGSTLEQYNYVSFYVDFTVGSLTSAIVKIEFSNDNTNWYQETVDAVDTATGIILEKLATRLFNATGKYRIAAKARDRYVRVSAIGVGTLTGSSMQIDAIAALDI